MNKFPEISTARLVLNEITSSDRKEIFGIFSDHKVIAHYDVEIFKEISEADNLIQYFHSQFRNNTGLRWAIRKKGDKTLIGSCGFTHWNAHDFSAVIGYDLAPNHWGHGYASEAVKAMLNWAFSENFPFNVNRLESIIMPSNKPSIALSEGLGFKLEGTLRDKVFCEGKFRDMNLYSLLRRDWLAQS